MEDKDEDSGSWKLGMGIVATGLIVIMSVGATSAGYYGRGGCWAHTNITGAVLTYSDSALSDLSYLDFSCEEADTLVSGPLQKQCKHGAWLPDDEVTCREVNSV